MSAQSIDQLLDRVESLPPAPHILPKLLKLLSDPDTDIGQVVDLIVYDPGLTAKVLQVSNSAWFGGAAPATDVGDAVNRLGLRCIYRLVAAASGSGTLRPKQSVHGFEVAALWRHSVITALAAQFMAQDHGQDESLVFTAALLHDTGKVVLAQSYRDSYVQLLKHVEPGPQATYDGERSQYGFDHSELGGRLLIRWKFPEPMVAGVSCHHRPSTAGSYSGLAACVAMANALAHLVDKPDVKLNGAGDALAEALSILNVSQEALFHYRDLTLENFEFVNALCRL
jgi:putative nucleotidyltransferase with HDIG domain